MNEFLAFRKMITPVIIQVVFWIGVACCVLGGLGVMMQGGMQTLVGLIGMLVGILAVRIYCELLILLFRIHDAVLEIRDSKSAPAAGFPVKPAP